MTLTNPSSTQTDKMKPISLLGMSLMPQFCKIDIQDNFDRYSEYIVDIHHMIDDGYIKIIDNKLAQFCICPIFHDGNILPVILTSFSWILINTSAILIANIVQKCMALIRKMFVYMRML